MMWLAMDTVKTELMPPHPVSLRSTVRTHGWVGLAPWGWDDDACVLWRSDRLSSGRTARIQTTQPDAGRIGVAVEGDDLSGSDVDEAAGLVRRWLSLNWDPAGAIAAARKADPRAAETIENGGGRLLRCSTFYEDFVKTVCTIQIAWSGSRRMVAALVEAGGGLFPAPVRVLELGEDGLRERGTGFRARSIVEATETMLERGQIDEAGRAVDGPISYDDLITLWGIRPLRSGPHGSAAARLQPHTRRLRGHLLLPPPVRHRAGGDRRPLRALGPVPLSRLQADEERVPEPRQLGIYVTGLVVPYAASGS